MIWWIIWSVCVSVFMGCNDERAITKEKYDSLLVEYENKVLDNNLYRSLIDTFVTQEISDSLVRVVGVDHIFFATGDTIYFVKGEEDSIILGKEYR